MIDRILGIILILGAIIGFILADMPIVKAIAGGTSFSQLVWMRDNIFWLLPLGGFLIYWRLNPIKVGIVAAVLIVILYVILHGGAIL